MINVLYVLFAEPVEWLDFDEFEDVLDLRAYHVIGEIINFNLLELPPQPKTVNKWTITTRTFTPRPVRSAVY